MKKIILVFFSVILSLASFYAIVFFASGGNPLGLFVGNHSYMTTKLVLTLGLNPNSCKGGCPLHTAAVLRDRRMIEILEVYGANIHVLDQYHNNVLNVVCTDSELLDYFISKGVDVNIQAIDRHGLPGMTPLICAVLNNSLDAVKLLVSKGADKTKGLAQWAGQKNVTPIQLAESKNFKEIVDILK